MYCLSTVQPTKSIENFAKSIESTEGRLVIDLWSMDSSTFKNAKSITVARRDPLRAAAESAFT